LILFLVTRLVEINLVKTIAKNILAAGFEYVTEKNGTMLFRKPKRFVNPAI
jgi:hypothetical protein